MGDGQSGGGTPPIDVDDWTQDFLNEAIQLELSVISSRNFPSLNRSSQPAAPSSSRPPPPAAPALAEWEAFPPFPSNGLASVGAGAAPSFSPPRELSQRFHERPQSQAPEVVEIRDPWGSRNGGPGARGSTARKEKEVDRLKRELGRVSKQLNHMEHECLELKKERARKDEELKFAFSQIETKDAEIHILKREKLEATSGDYLRCKLQFQNSSTGTEHTNHCKTSEDACAFNIPRNLERSTERYDRQINSATLHSPEDLSLDKLYQVPKRKNVRSDGTCAVSELKRRITTDHNLTTATGGSFLENPYAISPQIKCNKTVGTQTDIAQDDGPTALTDDFFTEQNISRKLLAIWSSSICGSLYYKTTGRELVSNLFVTCSADLFVLFGFMNVPSKTDPGPRPDRSFPQADNFPNIVLPDDTHSVDTVKVSRFHDILLKMHNEMAQMDTLFEALLDLCMSANVSIVLKSLHILHAILWQLFSNEIISTKRNNVLVDSSLHNTCDKQSTGMHNPFMKMRGYDGEYDETETGTEVSSFQLKIKSIALEKVRKDEDGCCSRSTFLSFARLVSLFETMRQISLRRSEEYILTKAVSIMNLIFMRSNPNLEREKFGLMPLLRTVSQLLQKQIGFDVQRQVLRLFFLLLNCPKALMMFCTGGKNGNKEMAIADELMDASALEKEISHILNGLSELLACRGPGVQELKLRRQVIIILAYIATYGQTGFEILLNTVTPQGVGFLESIVRLLMSELDAEVSDPAEAHGLCKERISLMREALILLNRLSSHPAYSKSTLGALTRTNAVASLTVDVANRIPQRSRYSSWKKKTQIEVEVADLARLFRSRVFAYLGENGPS